MQHSVRTTSTISESIQSEWDENSLDDRLERDYGIPQRLGRHSGFQPGMQHFVYHPSSSKHSRSFNGRTMPPAFDGHRSYPVNRVSQSHHSGSRTAFGGFDGHRSDPNFDFQNLNDRAHSQSRLIGAKTHRSKSFDDHKLTSTDLPMKPSRRHSKRSQNSPVVRTVSASWER